MQNVPNKKIDKNKVDKMTIFENFHELNDIEVGDIIIAIEMC